MRSRIACIVEGHSETRSVPILIRRIAAAVSVSEPQIPSPIRIPRTKLVKPGELERAVEFCGRKVAPHGGIVILIDAEDDCPRDLAPQLLERAKTARSDLGVTVVMATREFESWFLASIESLRGQRGVTALATRPAEPELIRGAKEWLARSPQGDRSYSETTDQPALASLFDMEAAAAVSRSFRKFRKDVEDLLRELAAASAP